MFIGAEAALTSCTPLGVPCSNATIECELLIPLALISDSCDNVHVLQTSRSYEQKELPHG